MKRKMKILYVAAEIAPYASAGGLGEVGRSLPKALIETGQIEVRRVMPLYRSLSGSMKYITDFPVELDQGYETCILKTDPENKDSITYFIENDRYFYRDNIYGYEDDNIRFFFFCKAVVDMLKHIAYKPDIIHTNDWHTGILPLLLKKEFPNIKSIYTIHNVSYQGYLPPRYLNLNLTQQELKQLGWPEWLNVMKAGILYSDLLTTVSPGYCEDIKRTEFGCGMAELISHKQKQPVGIINGIDTDSYNPKQDGILPFPFDGESLELKQKNKEVVLAEYGLPISELPLIVMITRLDYAKGIELLMKAINDTSMKDYNLILMASGNPYYQGLLASIAAGHQNHMIVDFDYNAARAKKIYAAADIYLMPSLFEPCGLGQLYAMRYGAVPVVNPVGGLKDTVIDDPKHPDNSNGFYLEGWSEDALVRAIRRAVDTYHTPEWDGYRKNCLDYDSSWTRSVREYKKLFEELLEN